MLAGTSSILQIIFFGFIFLLRSLLEDNDPNISVVTPLESEMPCKLCDYDLLMMSYGGIMILAGYFFNFTDNNFEFLFLLRSLLKDNNPPMSVMTPLASKMSCEL